MQDRKEILEALGYSDQEGDRILAANDPATPSYVLYDLATDASHKVRIAVASNPSAGELSLTELLNENDPEIISAVVDNDLCPDELKLLAYLSA